MDTVPSYTAYTFPITPMPPNTERPREDGETEVREDREKHRGNGHLLDGYPEDLKREILERLVIDLPDDDD